MYSTELIYRSWVEIDLEQLEKNYKLYLDNMMNPAKIMAVIKADAYGHGDVFIAKKLSRLGVDLFAVSNINEAILLRKEGVEGEILILGYTPIDKASDLVNFNITQALLDEKYAELLSQCDAASHIKVQFAIDTGMNRIGLDADAPEYCDTVIRKYSSIFVLNGIFTHLCVADTNKSESIYFTNQQIDKFENVSKLVSNLHLKYCHCLNSAGGLYHRCEYQDINNIIRLGIILYGLKPDYSNTLPNGIKPIMSWKTVVSMVKYIKKDETVGYGQSFKASCDMKIATIPTGYADGYNRLLSNKGYVLIKGKRAPIVGRICMDQMMVDVSNIEDIKIGDTVVLLGSSGNENYTADDMAKTVGSIGYEIVCDISKRVHRKYIGE